MRSARTCLRHCGLLVLSALALAATGCKDFNETFTNDTNRPMTRLIITVKIEGAAHFPHASQFYNNQPPARVDQTGGPDNGYYTYQLTYIFFPPVQPGESRHVGMTFDHDLTAKVVGHYFTFLNDAEIKRLAGFSMSPRIDPVQGLVVDVSNDAAAPGPIKVSQLQWAVNGEYVALGNLDWTDPVLGLLTWHDFTADLPLTLAPGDVVTFDVPDGPMAGKTHALVRWIATDPEGLVSQQPVMEMEIQSLPKATVLEH